MANEWMSALPSAWKPQDPNTQVQAAQAGAQTAATQAVAAQTAVAAEDANQERIRKQALQDIFAKSVVTKIKGGKIVHEIDNDAFHQNLQTSPVALGAYKAWMDTVNPAAATNATQQALAANATAQGGLDAQGLAQYAQGSDYAGQILAAGRAIQQAQATAGTDIAANKFAQSRLGTGSDAQPGSLVYNEDVKPKEMDATASAGHIGPEVVSALSKEGKVAAIYKLKAKGIVLPPNATPQQIADAANSIADAQVSAQSVQGTDLKQPMSLATSAFQTAASEPSIRNKAYGEIFGDELGVVQQKLGIRGAQLGVTGGEQEQALIKSLRDQGYAATPSKSADLIAKKGAYDWLVNTSNDIKEKTAELKETGKLEGDDTFHNTVSAWENAPMVAESISNLAGQQRFLEGIRTSPSYGALVEAADGNPVHFFRALASAKLGAQDQATVLSELGNIVDTQLRSGKAKSELDQYRIKGLKPSALAGGAIQFDKAKYSAAKKNGAGDIVGKNIKSGAWEVIK